MICDGLQARIVQALVYRLGPTLLILFGNTSCSVVPRALFSSSQVVPVLKPYLGYLAEVKLQRQGTAVDTPLQGLNVPAGDMQ